MREDPMTSASRAELRTPSKVREELLFAASTLHAAVGGNGDANDVEDIEVWFRPGFLVEAARVMKEAAALFDSLEAAEADSRRLDWLEANPCRCIPARPPMPSSVRTVRPEGLYVAPSIREAIDVASTPSAAPEPQ